MENIFNHKYWSWVGVVVLLLIVASMSGYLVGRWQQIGLYQEKLEKISDINPCT